MFVRKFLLIVKVLLLSEVRERVMIYTEMLTVRKDSKVKTLPTVFPYYSICLIFVDTLKSSNAVLWIGSYHGFLTTIYITHGSQYLHNYIRIHCFQHSCVSVLVKQKASSKLKR